MGVARPNLRRISPGYVAVRAWLQQTLDDRSRFVCLSPGQGPVVYPTIEENEAEVLELGQLVLQVARVMRLDHAAIASRRATIAAIEAVTRDLPDGHPFAESKTFPGFHRALESTLRDVRHAGLESDDLRHTATLLSPANPALLIALADTWDAVSERLREHNREFATDIMQRQIGESLPQAEPLGRLLFWWPDRDPLVERWVTWLAGQGVPIEVAVEGFDGRSDVFPLAEELRRRWHPETSSSPTSGWVRALFSDRSVDIQELPEVGHSQNYDPLSEVEWCIRGAFQSMSDGARPDQIGIYVCEPDSYLPLVEHAALRYGLPLEVTLQVPLVQNAFCRFLLDLLEVLNSDDVRRLQSVVRSSYLGFPADVLQSLGQLILGSIRRDESPWEVLTRSTSELGESYDWIRQVLAWRHRALEATRNMPQWLEMLHELLAYEPLPSSAMTESNPTMERDLRAKNALQRALTDLATMEGTERLITLNGFVGRCRREWAEAKVTLPQRVKGGVKAVTSVAELRDFEVLFVLGAAEGTLPSRRREDPILRDAARLSINESHPERGPLATSHETASQQRDDFIRICAAGRTRLHFSVPNTRDEQSVSPSFYLAELRRLAGQRYVETIRGSAEVIPAEVDCRLPHDLALRKAIENPQRDTDQGSFLQNDIARAVVRPDFEHGITTRDVASAYACGFQAGWYQVGILPSRSYDAMWRLSQIPAKVNLSRQPDLESVRTVLESAVQQLLAEEFSKMPYAEWRTIEARARRAVQSWVAGEERIRYSLGSNPTNTKVHVRMGEEGTRATLKTSSGDIRFREEASVIWTVNDWTFLREYRQSSPELREGDMKDHLKWGLKLAMVGKGSKAILFETPEGKLELKTLRDESSKPYVQLIPPGQIAIPMKQLSGTSAREYLKDLVQAAEVAIARLSSAEMRPNPGPACQDCALGEICRSSEVHHDTHGGPA